MTVSATISLRKSVRDALLADSGLATLVGAGRVFDDAPRDVEPPYVSFGESRSRDWSTGTDRGEEATLVVDAWSAQPGTREALAIAARVQDVLDDASLTLAGHCLVNLRFAQSETRREANGRRVRASLRFRAVMEAV